MPKRVAIYLGLALRRCANYWSSLTPWGGEFIVQTFGRQAIPMVWDYAEGKPAILVNGKLDRGFVLDRKSHCRLLIWSPLWERVAGRRSEPINQRFKNCLHRPTLLRQHRLR